MLPADSHVHSEWSWDAARGSMEGTCARAVAMGLPAVAFTEHADHTAWGVLPSDLDGHEKLRAFVTPDGLLTPPPLDIAGYLDCVRRCRDLFPDLVIISGVELGEPHRRPELAKQVLMAGQFDRILGSVHCLASGGEVSEMPDSFRRLPAADVMREYLAEVHRLVASATVFSVLAHIDYPVRYWPTTAAPFDPTDFETEFRDVLRELAVSGRALEVNTRVPLHGDVVRWWREEGGQAVTVGSDAHEPGALAHGFVAAASLVEATGFYPGLHPFDLWTPRPAVTTP